MSALNGGYAVFGHFSVPCGLAVSARNTLRILRARGEPFAVYDVSGEGALLGRLDDESSEPWASGTNLFHLNPHQIAALLAGAPNEILEASVNNVCLPFWELSSIPAAWVPALDAMDAVLAPTRFVADAIRRACPRAQIVHFPQTVFLPDGVVGDRPRFGLPADAVVFVTAFAAQSVMERKNPWATIDVFREAFGRRDDVVLLVRAHVIDKMQGTGSVARLREAARHDPRVRIVDEPLDYSGVLSLYASADVYVSLHRAEGLGLGMMEAMMLGCPVMATGWSGNMDFMTAENSWPVDYDLVPVDVPPGNAYHSDEVGFRGVWAEARQGHAADVMRWLAADPELRQRLAQRAQEDVRRAQQHIALGEPLDELGRVLAEEDVARAHAGKAAQLGELVRQYRAAERRESSKRLVVSVMRRLRLKPPAPDIRL